MKTKKETYIMADYMRSTIVMASILNLVVAVFALYFIEVFDKEMFAGFIGGVVGTGVYLITFLGIAKSKAPEQKQ